MSEKDILSREQIVLKDHVKPTADVVCTSIINEEDFDKTLIKIGIDGIIRVAAMTVLEHLWKAGLISLKKKVEEKGEGL